MEVLILPLVLFLVAGALLGIGMLSAGSIFGPKRNTAVKEMPYESGMDPIHDTRRKFDVRFHLVAIAFLIFDVELLFLYPWAVASHNDAGINATVAEAVSNAESLGAGPASFSRLLVFGEVMVFMVLLAAGFVYAWRKGVFRWR